MKKTLTFSPKEDIQGWVNFYSFLPDFMCPMNNRFYTFKGGNLYLHNSNEVRNNFYGEQYTSTIQTVFNDAPTETKLFRTLAIQGDSGWSATVETDIQDNAYIEQDWFEKKEGAWFAYLRSLQTTPAFTGEYALRSASGIGRSSDVTGSGANVFIDFSINPLISIGSVLSVGDILYYSLPPYDTPVLCGEVTNIQQDYRNSLNRITVDTTITGGGIPPITTAFIMFIKNQIANSLGILGHYAIVDLECDSTEKVEIFTLEAQIQRSNP